MTTEKIEFGSDYEYDLRIKNLKANINEDHDKLRDAEYMLSNGAMTKKDFISIRTNIKNMTDDNIVSLNLLRKCKEKKELNNDL